MYSRNVGISKLLKFYIQQVIYNRNMVTYSRLQHIRQDILYGVSNRRYNTKQVIYNRIACIQTTHGHMQQDQMYSRIVGISKPYKVYIQQVIYNKICSVPNCTLLRTAGYMYTYCTK